jgi:hypothetical protein
MGILRAPVRWRSWGGTGQDLRHPIGTLLREVMRFVVVRARLSARDRSARRHPCSTTPEPVGLDALG